MILCVNIHWVETLRLLLSVETLCLSFEAFVGIAGSHSHIATLGSIAIHVDSYYKGEMEPI